MGSPSPSRVSTWHILGYTGQRKVEEKQKAQSTYPEKGSSSIFFIITTSLTNHKQARTYQMPTATLTGIKSSIASWSQLTNRVMLHKQWTLHTLKQGQGWRLPRQSELPFFLFYPLWNQTVVDSCLSDFMSTSLLDQTLVGWAVAALEG